MMLFLKSHYTLIILLEGIFQASNNQNVPRQVNPSLKRIAMKIPRLGKHTMFSEKLFLRL